jgi:predicted metalloprotease with PDZ domain
MLPQWLGLIKAELGIEALEDLKAMQKGEKLVIPPKDCLGWAGLELRRCEQEVWELGLNQTDDGTVVKLVKGGRAEKAGLKVGDEIVAMTPIWQPADEISMDMVVRVQRKHELLQLRYWPRSWKTVESYQWMVIVRD